MTTETLQKARIESQQRYWEEKAVGADIIARQEQKHAQSQHAFNAEKATIGLRKTSIDEYRHWLNGFLENGGKVTHYYDYPFSRQTFYTAMSSGHLTPQYGASSFCVLAPAGVKITSGGHNNVLHVEGFSASGSFIPMFSDI
jgi:hypothetical protein